MFGILALAAVLAETGCLKAQSGGHYVSPDGKFNAAGTMEDPLSLAGALAHPEQIHPGETIWLRGGTYGEGKRDSIFKSVLKGTPESPIVVRQYPGERAIINGTLSVEGKATWFWGFEVTNTVTARGANSGELANNEGVISRSPNSKFINLIVHDTRQGFGVWSEGPDVEVYGNLIYHNGYQDDDRGHGHGIYVQNGEGSKLISDNIIFNQFGAGLHAFGSDSNGVFVRNITAEGNILFSNGRLSAKQNYADNMIFASGNAVENVVVRDNYTYFPPKANGYSRMGWQWSPPNRNAVMTGNYFIGGYFALGVAKFAEVEFVNNTLYSDDGFLAMLDLNPDQNPTAYKWDQNTIYGKSQFWYKGRAMEFDGWKRATNLDATSNFRVSRPTGVWKFVRPNKYEAGRGNIVIYNWDQLSVVGVDLTAVLKPGESYEIRDAQNFFADPVAKGTFDGGAVFVPMRLTEMAVPNGEIPSPPKHTAPEFGAFIVLRTAEAQQ